MLWLIGIIGGLVFIPSAIKFGRYLVYRIKAEYNVVFSVGVRGECDLWVINAPRYYVWICERIIAPMKSWRARRSWNRKSRNSDRLATLSELRASLLKRGFVIWPSRRFEIVAGFELEDNKNIKIKVKI